MKEAKPIKSKHVKIPEDFGSMYRVVPGQAVLKAKIRTHSAGGILLPDNQKSLSPFPLVVAVGKNIQEVEVGERVNIKDSSQEAVMTERPIILKESTKDGDYVYMQISTGIIIGAVTQQFIEVANAAYAEEERLLEEQSKMKKVVDAPEILVKKPITAEEIMRP